MRRASESGRPLPHDGSSRGVVAALPSSSTVAAVFRVHKSTVRAGHKSLQAYAERRSTVHAKTHESDFDFDCPPFRTENYLITARCCIPRVSARSRYYLDSLCSCWPAASSLNPRQSGQRETRTRWLPLTHCRNTTDKTQPAPAQPERHQSVSSGPSCERFFHPSAKKHIGRTTLYRSAQLLWPEIRDIRCQPPVRFQQVRSFQVTVKRRNSGLPAQTSSG
jgi:hypothetical protein